MTYCEYVKFDNLKTIQEKCLKLFPNDMLKEDGIFYNKKDLEFLTIDELKSELKKLNLLDRVRSIGFNVTQPKNLDSGIHVDSGQHYQSLNIPLQNCENTFINHFIQIVVISLFIHCVIFEILMDFHNFLNLFFLNWELQNFFFLCLRNHFLN